jgi:outer membrane biosynthesis protein TonB
MKNPLKMLKEIKTLLGVEMSEEQTELEELALAQMKLDNGAVLEAEAFEVGKEVFIVTDDEKVALPDGTYKLEGGDDLVAKDGIIESIGAAEEKEEEPTEEVEAKEEEEVEAAEHEEEDMKKHYATKEELAEVKKLVEEIKKMVEDKKELAEQKVEEVEELKEQLSEAAAKPIAHKPEKKTNLNKILNVKQNKNTTYFRVLENINKFKNN